MQTDSQQRLDRSLRKLLGDNSLLIKTYNYNEVVDMLIAARNKPVSFIEFNGNMEPVCEAKLKSVFSYQTFKTENGTIVTRINW